MNLVTRKQGESITIYPDEAIPLSEPLSSVFGGGPIEIIVSNIKPLSVQLQIDAAEHLRVTVADQPHTPEAVYTPMVSQHSGKILAKNVFRQRVSQRLSIKSLSEKAEIPFYTLCAIERGMAMISLDELDRLSEALDIEVSDLLASEE